MCLCVVFAPLGIDPIPASGGMCSVWPEQWSRECTPLFSPFQTRGKLKLLWVVSWFVFFFANHHNVSCFVTNIQQYVQQYVQHVLYRSYLFSFLLHLLRFFVWFHFFSGVLFSSHYLWDGRRRSGWVRRTTKRKDRQFLMVWNTIKSYTNCWKLCHIFSFFVDFW